MILTTEQVASFQQTIREYYLEHGRHDLPWRTTHTTPYHVLVSEIMLQQTSVERVIPKFLEFVDAFPTIDELAKAKQSDVLTHWIGLGYNRRGLYLYRAVQKIVSEYKGIVPSSPALLRTLPGIGPYASASIATFAYNQPEIVIDTNIRTIYIHHFLSDKENISDFELIPLIQQTLDYESPREWYSALMDYGVYLKKTVGNMTRQSKHYTVQSPLHDSRRELRGALMKILKDSTLPRKKLIEKINQSYPHNPYPAEDIIEQLKRENIISEINNKMTLA